VTAVRYVTKKRLLIDFKITLAKKIFQDLAGEENDIRLFTMTAMSTADKYAVNPIDLRGWRCNGNSAGVPATRCYAIRGSDGIIRLRGPLRQGLDPSDPATPQLHRCLQYTARPCQKE
jgi:hypothetical protein